MCARRTRVAHALICLRVFFNRDQAAFAQRQHIASQRFPLEYSISISRNPRPFSSSTVSTASQADRPASSAHPACSSATSNADTPMAPLRKAAEPTKPQHPSPITRSASARSRLVGPIASPISKVRESSHTMSPASEVPGNPTSPNTGIPSLRKSRRAPAPPPHDSSFPDSSAASRNRWRATHRARIRRRVSANPPPAN